MAMVFEKKEMYLQVPEEFIEDIEISMDVLVAEAREKFMKGGDNFQSYYITILDNDFTKHFRRIVVCNYCPIKFYARVLEKDRDSMIEKIISWNSHLTINRHLIQAMYPGNDFVEGYVTLVIPYAFH